LAIPDRRISERRRDDAAGLTLMPSRTHPVDFEVFKNAFLSVAEEMGVTLCRTGFSPNIKERLDYSCAIYDARGDTIAQGDHMPVHLGAMPLSVRAAIDAVPLAPGDVVMLNDPFHGGTHLPDITLVSPVFIKAHPSSRSGSRRRSSPGRPQFYVANRAHHSDVGGMSPGSMPVAREIYQEGFIIPPVLLVRGGRIVKDAMALLLANVRTPDEREGDLTAQIAANRVAEQRLRAIVARHGPGPTLAYAARLQDYTERVMRATIRSIPDGEYVFDDALDDDGFGNQPVKIQACVRISGDRAVIDFAGSDPQVEGNVNANYAVTLSACLYAFRCLIQDNVLYNAGIARALTVVALEGTVVNARRPAAVAGGNVETSQRITDVILGALGKALPDRLPAASQGTMNNVTFGGTDPGTGRRFAYYETIGGGMGGRRGLEGLSGVHTHMSNTRNTPVEAIEHDLPVRVRRYGLRTGSAGRGRWPGGEGIVREYEFLTGTSVTILSDRRQRSPYGAEGGGPGGLGRNTAIRSGKEESLPGKIQLELGPGDRLRIETPGGGGYGKK
jgi:N-methylhydantoinase B/oxoprolinase/acetone carboxylase alpha subunit